MYVTGFDGIYTKQYSFSKLFAMHQHWDCGAEFQMLSHDRPTNALLYFSSGSAIFEDGREKEKILCSTQSGTLVYIPKGSRYLIKFSDSTKVHTLLTEFLIHDENGEEFLLSDSVFCPFADGTFIHRSLEELIEACRAPILSPALVNSLCYGIFHTLSKRTLRRNLADTSFGTIAKSISIIESCAEPDMNIAELAAESGVSVGTFNSLFIKYCGMSPGAYRASLRLERAKKLLSDSALSVREIAEALGFADTGYFCRFFKKHTGMTALKWRERSGGTLETSDI